MPTLQIAHRTSVDEPAEQGLRGGGGAIVLEMVPQAGVSSAVGEEMASTRTAADNDDSEDPWPAD